MKDPGRSRILLAFMLLTGELFSQPLADYYSRHSFLMAPPGTFQGGLVGFANPANLALLSASETRFLWSTDGAEATSFRDWGIFAGVRGFGFGALRQHTGNLKATDYRVSTGFGSRALALGAAYAWSVGDLAPLRRQRMFSAGTVVRPSRYFSFGLIGNFSLQSSAREGVAEIGIRPLGTSRLTFFADAVLQDDTKVAEAPRPGRPWSAGAALQLVSGIHIIGRRFENDAFTFGFTVNFGGTGIGAQAHFEAEQDHAYNSYMVRAGGMQPSIFPELFGRGKRYVALNMKGRVGYHKYVLFDRDTHRLLDILKDIRAAAEDERVAAIAVNLSSVQMRSEHAWEIREELRKARQAGKKVLAFLDNAGMTNYHLASAADKIVLDPLGMLMLEGYVLGRTYLKGTLEKLGLGFDEWRFFTYKSALEGFSREKMSDADRQQYQAYVDDWYELVRSDVCAGRGFTPERFDQLVDEEVIFLPEAAVNAGLVDTLGRWSDVSGLVKNQVGKKMREISANSLLSGRRGVPPQTWGQLPEIAVVYGLGVCAMDEGIKARWLERVFLRLEKKESVKAVVFRVDSPGGDAMASDLVAEALRKCSEKKPVIISQGQVAGSGGYWISMYGDTIVAGPNTFTGSIGVIGGWLYDKGLTEKLGMTADHVKRGAHAELGFGVSLPLIGGQIPSRNLTPDEREKVESIFMKFYEGFVQKVAKGRNMPVEEVRKIAEGRFYSGTDGKAAGLVDELGGMLTALEMAQQKAGLRPDAEIAIVEIPRYKGLLNLRPRFSPVATRIGDDPVLQYIRMASERPGQPLPLLLPGTYPAME